MFIASLKRAVYPAIVQINRFCSRGVCTRSQLTMDVYPIPALSDNYMYILVDRASRQAAVVDPVEPDKVLAKVRELKAHLKLLLTTHHHWDHAGGNQALIDKLGDSSLKVYGGDDRVTGLTDPVRSGDVISFGSARIRCLHTPCHTTGHICYHVDDGQGDHVVFTGECCNMCDC